MGILCNNLIYINKYLTNTVKNKKYSYYYYYESKCTDIINNFDPRKDKVTPIKSHQESVISIDKNKPKKRIKSQRRVKFNINNNSKITPKKESSTMNRYVSL